MKRKNTIFSKLYVVLCLAFFYLPILVTMIFSFNSSKSLTRFTGFSLRWYGELINNMEISKAVMFLSQWQSWQQLFPQCWELLQPSAFPNPEKY